MTIMAEQQTSASYALSDLVRRRRSELGYSLRKLAERCIDDETGVQEIKHAWIERLEKREPVIPPQTPQLRALGIGLRLPLRDIQDAAGEQFLGIQTRQIGSDGRVRLLLNRASQMSEEDLGRLLAISETFPLDAERDQSGST